ncbi:GTP-binding protein 2-like protein [Phlyctochytrium arcticum]|nr:GTP-binding protein 2-like protein [Phlyctochytrium arcticum]
MFRKQEATSLALSTTMNSFMAEREHDTRLPPEVEQGNVEYKLQLINTPPDRLEHLITQLKWRLAEGYGEAMYEIGVSDKGVLVGLTQENLNNSFATLKKMGEALRADVSIIRERVVTPATVEPVRKVAEVLFRKCLTDDQHFLEIRVAIIGGADAGKSTLLGVLAYSENDNGRGKARLNLLRHRHEIESGRTSSISHQIVGFDPHGAIINYASTNVHTWAQICETAAKVVTFLDMCGHPKYQKTTLSGLTGHAPDYGCLIIGANTGVTEITKEHLGIAVALKVPVFIVITKIDIANSTQLTRTVSSLLTLLKLPGIRRLPLIVQNEDDLVVAVSNFLDSRVIPIFLTSSVTGENLSLLIGFLNLLHKPVNKLPTLNKEEVQFQVEEVYSVPDVGSVVGGKLLSGGIPTHRASSNNVYYLGPDRGHYALVRIMSIHRQRCPVSFIQSGQAATCALGFLSNPNGGFDHHTEPPDMSNMICSTSAPAGFRLRKGQVLLSELPPPPVWDFEAELTVLHALGQVGVGCHGMLYVGAVRQGAKVIRISPVSSQSVSDGKGVAGHATSPVPTALKTGDCARVQFQFAHEPEWIVAGRTVLFRGEGSMKCVGEVVKVNGAAPVEDR